MRVFPRKGKEKLKIECNNKNFNCWVSISLSANKKLIAIFVFVIITGLNNSNIHNFFFLYLYDMNNLFSNTNYIYYRQSHIYAQAQKIDTINFINTPICHLFGEN